MIGPFDTYMLFGWVGVLFIVIAYLMYITKRFKIDYLLYHLLNFLGAAGLILSTLYTQSWPALTLASIFAGISIVYMVKILRTKPKYRDLRD